MIDKNDPRLTAFLLDELDDDSAAEIQSAIDASPELQEHVDGLRSTIGILQGTLGGLSTGNVPAMSDEQLRLIDERANTHITQQPVVVEHENHNRIPWRNLAIAALVLYAVGISFFAFRKPTLTAEQLAKLNVPVENDSLLSTTQTSGEAAEAVQYRYETRDREVPVTVMAAQTKTRMVPVTKTRVESRVRTVMKDGEPVEEIYQVSVPFTENVSQTYTVQVPVTSTKTESYQVRIPVDANGNDIGPAQRYQVSVPVSDNAKQDVIDQSELEVGRRRLGRSELLETTPTAEDEPTDILVAPVVESAASAMVDSEQDLESAPTAPTADPFTTPKIIISEEEEPARTGFESESEVSDPVPANPNANPFGDPFGGADDGADPFSGGGKDGDHFGGGGKGGDDPFGGGMDGGDDPFGGGMAGGDPFGGDPFAVDAHRGASPVISTTADGGSSQQRPGRGRGMADADDMMGMDMEMEMMEMEMGGMMGQGPPIQYPDADGWREMNANADFALAPAAVPGDVAVKNGPERTDASRGEEVSLEVASAAGDTITPDVGGQLLERVKEESEGTEDRLRAEVRAQARWALRRMRTNPVGVGQKLRSLLATVETTEGVNTELRKELESQLRTGIQVASRREAEFIEKQANLEQLQQASTYTQQVLNALVGGDWAGRAEALEKEREALRADLRKMQKRIDEMKAKAKKLEAKKTWKPASAATNRARLSVGHHDDLPMVARDTYVRIDGFRARVFFDCYYYNDRRQQLEGQFMLRLPTDASLHYFAFGPTNLPAPDPTPATGKPGASNDAQVSVAENSVRLLRKATKDGNDLARRAVNADFIANAKTTFASVKAAHVVPRQKAALAYEETVRRRVDPALVEWSGPGIFQTKVFPLLPNRLHRIVVGYDVNLKDRGDDRVFTLDLPKGEAGGRVEFDIAAAAGTQATITPETEPFIAGKRAYYRYENAEPRDYTVSLTGTGRVVLNTGKPGDADVFFATRLQAELPDEPAKVDTRRAVFLLDTSWSDKPAAFSRRLQLLKEVLQQNSATINEFAVLMFNVEQRWWQGKFTKNSEQNRNAFLKDADTIALEGATDLHSALSAAASADWLRQDNGPLPNYFLLSDAVATWGKTDLASLADPLKQIDRSKGGGSLFAYHLAGHTSDKTAAQWLADAGSGAVFDVAEQAELSKVATAHLSRPWKVTDISADGADEILLQGSTATVYPNQTLMVAGRGLLKGPLKIQCERGSEKRTIVFNPRVSVASPAAARLYGQFAVERLEPYSDELEEVTIAFARYFRVPGRTCSMVMLESAEDYKRFKVNVSPEDDRLVIASTSVIDSITEQEAELLQQRQQPRKQFMAWVDSLQDASLVKLPTALRLAMKRMPEDAFGFDAKPLSCQSWTSKQQGIGFENEMKMELPRFAAVMSEARRKLDVFGVDDAIKTASTLVEAKPSDPDTLRSVAFRAIEWNRSDQAAPLLWRLVKARPYQPQGLLLLARAMSESEDTDSAVVCYDLVCNGNWNQRWSSGAKDIARVELLHLLERIDSGEIKSSIPQYARARLQQLRTQWSDEGIDIAVVMHWNTDRTDVDLHVTEPSGEVCYYSHKQTKTGGQITQDITEGLGPEMYTLKTAPDGSYKIEAKYYSSDNNRTKTPSETLVTVFQNLGRPNVTSTTKAVTLDGKGDKQQVHEFKLQH